MYFKGSVPFTGGYRVQTGSKQDPVVILSFTSHAQFNQIMQCSLKTRLKFVIKYLENKSKFKISDWLGDERRDLGGSK